MRHDLTFKSRSPTEVQVRLESSCLFPVLALYLGSKSYKSKKVLICDPRPPLLSRAVNKSNASQENVTSLIGWHDNLKIISVKPCKLLV